MAEVKADGSRAVRDEFGGLVAYVARREGFDGEHWFVSIGRGVKLRLCRAASDAIVSLEGVPSADVLAREINRRVAGLEAP